MIFVTYLTKSYFLNKHYTAECTDQHKTYIKFKIVKKKKETVNCTNMKHKHDYISTNIETQI